MLRIIRSHRSWINRRSDVFDAGDQWRFDCVANSDRKSENSGLSDAGDQAWIPYRRPQSGLGGPRHFSVAISPPLCESCSWLHGLLWCAVPQRLPEPRLGAIRIFKLMILFQHMA
jgi:hypothetical protein